MNLSIPFRTMRGVECTLTASFDAGGAIIWWDSVDDDGAHVELSSGDKWLAIVAMHAAVKEGAA